MRQSLMSVILAAAILLHSSSSTSPGGLVEDSSSEQDAFASLMSEEAVAADPAADGKARGSRVIVVADPSLWRELQVLRNGMALYKRRADDQSQTGEHRPANQDLSFPILRRDTMRCMVGRVYRPCWEV
ncbi:pro-melanin-concentrating hormone, like [Nerophis ophidion]|uniref:pro-melanin-concentrating hormone, like n=1 Tax=Nerophis ophidion TaxID=159077 RepID=UPI002AE02A49|nr:pro-melanin-concentrating hormone, like [Nerophis ophidion]